MEQLSKFFTEVIDVLKAMSGYLQNPSYELWTVIKKDEVVFGQNEKKVYLKGDTTAEDVLNSFGWTANPIEEGFINFVILYLSTYGLADCYRIEIYNMANPRIDFTVNRKGKTDQLVVVQKEGRVLVYYGELIVATSSSYDYDLLTYVGKFIKQLNSPVYLSGQNIWTIIRCCDLLNYFTNDIPFKDFTYNVIVAASLTKLFIKYKDNVLLEAVPIENGKVEVGTTPFNKTEMSVRQLIAVMIDFGPMLETIKGMKIIGEFNRAAAFSHFYMLQELLKIILPFEGDKSICIGDRDRPPFVVINNYMITIDLYTNAISWYNIKAEGPAEWKAAPIEDAYVVLRESLALPVVEPEVEQDEQLPVITKEDIEKCEVKAEPEEEPEDAQEEKEDTQEDTRCEDESNQGEESSSEDDDQWDSDDPEEDDDYSDDEDDEEEEETSEDSEDDEDEDDEDAESDYGDDDSEPDDDDIPEESFELPTPKSLSTVCLMMFGRVFNMFTGQPSTRLAIQDKDGTVIISWPGSPCPVQLTLTGYPKEKQNPEGPWLFEATASFQDRTFSTNPQSLIECVNDYKETLESLTTPSK